MGKIKSKCDSCNLEVESKKGENIIEKQNDCKVKMDMMNEMRIHMKENDLRGEKSENENKNEFGVQNEKELVKGITRDVLRLEESLRL